MRSAHELRRNASGPWCSGASSKDKRRLVHWKCSVSNHWCVWQSFDFVGQAQLLVGHMMAYEHIFHALTKPHRRKTSWGRACIRTLDLQIRSMNWWDAVTQTTRRRWPPLVLRRSMVYQLWSTLHVVPVRNQIRQIPHHCCWCPSCTRNLNRRKRAIVARMPPSVVQLAVPSQCRRTTIRVLRRWPDVDFCRTRHTKKNPAMWEDGSWVNDITKTGAWEASTTWAWQSSTTCRVDILMVRRHKSSTVRPKECTFSRCIPAEVDVPSFFLPLESTVASTKHQPLCIINCAGPTGPTEGRQVEVCLTVPGKSCRVFPNECQCHSCLGLARTGSQKASRTYDDQHRHAWDRLILLRMPITVQDNTYVTFRKKTQKNKETAELRKWWRSSWCHHEWKPKAAPVQQSPAQISRFHKPWCQDAPRHQPWKSPAHFQICFPVLHHIGPHLVQLQVFLPAAQDQRSDEEKWPMQPWPRAQQNAPCCQSHVPFSAKLRRTQLHLLTPERQHHRVQPPTDYPLAFEWNASVSMKVRPCGCPEPERLVVVVEHLEGWLLQNWSVQVVYDLSGGHSHGQKSHVKCSTPQRMCNLLRRSYVNSEPNIAHWSSEEAPFLVGLSWTRSETTNCLIPSLRWSYLWTCRHRWTRANSAYSFAHGHQICSSVHQKFLSLLRRIFRVNSSDPPFQKYVPSCTDGPRRCVVGRSLQSGRVSVQKQVCGCSSCCMQLKHYVLLIYMSCHLSRPTSFSQRLQQLSHRFVVCFLTSNWRRIVEESRSRRDSSMTVVFLFTASRVPRFGVPELLLVWRTAVAVVLSILVKFSSLRYLQFVKTCSCSACPKALLWTVVQYCCCFFCLLSLCFVMLHWTSSSCAWEVITSASHIRPHQGKSWTAWRGRSSMHSFRLRRRINGFRSNTWRHVCGSSNPIAEVRGTLCWTLDLEFEADKEVTHELHFHCDLRQVASLLARDLFPPPRAGLCVFIVDTIRAWNEMKKSSTNSRRPAPLTVVKKSCTMLHVSSHELCTLKLWVWRTKSVSYKKEITELSPFLSFSWAARATRPLPINWKRKRRRDKFHPIISSITCRKISMIEFHFYCKKKSRNKLYWRCDPCPNLCDVLGRLNSQHSCRLVDRMRGQSVMQMS